MKKIPILALNLTVEQEERIRECLNFNSFEIIHDENEIGDGFYVVVNDLFVSSDFCNLMLWGSKTFDKDKQTVFIDTHTPITDRLPKKANDKVYMRPYFSGFAYGSWKNKIDQICKTEDDRKMIQAYMDKHGLIVVAPFVSRVDDGLQNTNWIDCGYYRPVSRKGFHFK